MGNPLCDYFYKLKTRYTKETSLTCVSQKASPGLQYLAS